ncbi:hypothetical protein LTR56_003676 [Elasticomyces elasticus]|nr:hypothetical protein LTR22_016903 [Elasticomyces elasticus]KAK3655254.1 hypothetical protein LTR56_003676 [Elasticomyces elasticus]KAK4913533.1 hypothetical protein LTR49_018149 [Elasticomyces elasticus]KAK5767266.1 hypothetical protein LTS12_002418 [Elasticomyces elasticus]
MVIRATRDEVALKVRFYAEQGDLLDKRVVRASRTTSVDDLSSVLQEDIVSVIGATDDHDFVTARDGQHEFRYDIGFRFEISGFESYTWAKDEYPYPNIDTLADLFLKPDRSDKVVDVVVDIELVKAGPKKDDWTVKVLARRYDWCEKKLYRIGISTATDTESDVTPEDRDALMAKLNAAEEDNEIATYDALLASRGWNAKKKGPPTDLIATPVHDFGNLCFGDVTLITKVDDSYKEHIYFKPFDGNVTKKNLMDQIRKYYSRANPKQVSSGIPLLPFYTWNDIERAGTFVEAGWPKSGIKLAVQYVDRMELNSRIVFPEDLIVKLKSSGTNEGVYMRNKIIKAMQTSSPTTKAQREVKLMSCSDLFEKQYKKGWELELWVMQQDPAPRKIHRWLTGGGGRGVQPITEFALSEALSSEAVERGDFRVYMQAIIGSKGEGQWMVTGSQYEKHQDSDDEDEEDEEEEEEEEEEEQPEDQEPDEAVDDDGEKDSQNGDLDEEEDVEDQDEGADGGRPANSTAKRPLNRRSHPSTSRPSRSGPNGGNSRSSKPTSSFTPINGNTTGSRHSGNSRPISTTRPPSEEPLNDQEEEETRHRTNEDRPPAAHLDSNAGSVNQKFPRRADIKIRWRLRDNDNDNQSEHLVDKRIEGRIDMSATWDFANAMEYTRSHREVRMF